MPDDKKKSSVPFWVPVAAVPAVYATTQAIRKMEAKGYLDFPRAPTTSSFLAGLRKANLKSNQGLDLGDFFTQNRTLFAKEPELARTAWVQAVQSTDPFASEILSFGGDLKNAPAGKVVSSIEQTLQRNHSIFMARIFNKFKSNVVSLRKHQEITGTIPQFKAVEGLTFPAPRNVSVNSLPSEIAAFHQRFIKDTGITPALMGPEGPMVKYYTRKGWEGYGTYVMSFMKGNMPFDITVPISRGGTLIEGLTQSARRVATGVGILSEGQIQRMARHEFHLLDIEKSILPRIMSGEYKSGYDIQGAIEAAYKANIYSLEARPNLSRGFLSRAERSYSRVKGQAFDIRTEGALSQLREGELYRSVFRGPTGEQFKQVMGQEGIYPFPGGKSLAQGRVSSFNAAEWFMTPPDVDWAGQPRQINRTWRASDKAVAEMMSSGSAKWSIFETQAWRRDFGANAAPWVPTIYVDPVKHGAVLERLGIKEGEMGIADISSFRAQSEVVGQPFPIHLGSVEKGVQERIRLGATGRYAFSPGEILGYTPEGKAIEYKKGMKLLGLEPFETTGRGQEFALMYEQTLEAEQAGKYFGPKGVRKFIDRRKIASAVREMTRDLPAEERAFFTELGGRVQIATTDALKYQHNKNTQLITGLWKMMNRRNAKMAYDKASKAAAFLADPVSFVGQMRGGFSSSANFLKGLERFAVVEGGLTEGAFYSVFGQGTSGLSIGISNPIFHEPMAMTGAGALGSVEPRIFDVLGAHYGPLGAQMSEELQKRLIYSNPEKLAAYEGLTKTLASVVGKTSGKIGWDITQRGYESKAFQSFIEGGGGFMKLGADQPDVFVPGADVLTPYKTAAGEVIPGDLAREYHNLARRMAELHTQGKRVDLEAAGNAVKRFTANILEQQAPFGSGVGAVGRGQVVASRYLRVVSEWGGQRPEGVMEAIIPQYMGEQMFEELANIPGADIEGIRAMNERFLKGEGVGGMVWRHPFEGPYSAQPILYRMGERINEPIIAMHSKMIDIGLKNPIEISPMVGMGADRDADILSAMFVSPDLEKNIRKGWVYADNEFTQTYMEHMVRAQIIKTKAAGGAEVLAAQEKKVADAMKLALGQEWIGKLSLQTKSARQAVAMRLTGQQAANAAFILGTYPEQILKSKHLSGARVLEGEFSALLGGMESSFEAARAGDIETGAQRFETVLRNMFGTDETSRQLLEQEVRIPQNVEAVRAATGVKSMRQVLPSINLAETSRDIMNAIHWSQTTGIEEMAQMAAGRKAPSMGALGKYLNYTGSVLSGSKGIFAGVSEAAIRSKNFMASMGAGLIENKSALAWGFAGSLAIAAALSKPQDMSAPGAELIPDAKTASQFTKAASRMAPEDILPPEQPLGEPTVPPMMTTPTVRILPGGENRNINISARSRSRLNTEDMVRRYSQRTGFNRANVNVRDSTSRLSKYEIADKILK